MRWFALLVVLFAAGVTSAGDPLPPGATLRLGDLRFRAGGEIRRLRFSENGAVLSGWVIGLDGKLRAVAWDATSGVPLPPPADHPPPDPSDRTTPAARLAGNRVLTAGPGCAGRVWDANSGRQLALLSGHVAPVTAVAVSLDGKLLATGSADGLVRTWCGDSFRPLSSMRGHVSEVRTIHVSPDGMRAVTTGDDRAARVWDLTSGKELRAFPATRSVELTADGTSVVLIGGTTTVRDVLTGLEIVPASQPTPRVPTLTELLTRIGISVACSPDGRTIAVAHRDGTLGIYELATSQRRRLLVGHLSGCNAMAFTPDGTRLLTAGSDHTVLVWAIRVQDAPMPEAIKQETHAAKLWATMTTGPADAAHLAMARLAAEPPAAVKMARLRLRPAEAADSDPRLRLADARAVELLESLGTLAAHEFLEELATGNPEAHRTREAKRALERFGGMR